MKRRGALALILAEGAVLVSCATQLPAGLDRRVSPNLVTATTQQAAFVEAVKALRGGETESEVRETLGAPSSAADGVWGYILHEDPIEGGCAVFATVRFDEGGLAAVEVPGAHVTLSPLKDITAPGEGASAGGE